MNRIGELLDSVMAEVQNVVDMVRETNNDSSIYDILAENMKKSKDNVLESINSVNICAKPDTKKKDDTQKKPDTKKKDETKKKDKPNTKNKDKPDTKKKDKPDIEKYRCELLTYRNDLQTQTFRSKLQKTSEPQKANEPQKTNEPPKTFMNRESQSKKTFNRIKDILECCV